MRARSLRLVQRDGPSIGQPCHLPEEGAVRIGSSSACGIVLKLPGVHAVHGTVSCKRGLVFLAVEEGASDVLVNGTAVRRKFLEPGDVVEIGAATLALEVAREVNKAPGADLIRRSKPYVGSFTLFTYG